MTDPTQAYLQNTRARDYVRWLMAEASVGGDRLAAAQAFAARWPQSKNLDAIRKAAVPAMTVSDLDPTETGIAGLAAAFAALTRPKSILGRLAGVRPVPFNTRFPLQTSRASVGWVGEGQPVLVGKLQLETETFSRSKVAGIVVVTEELARSSSPDAEQLISLDLAASVGVFTDRAFLDPTIAEVPEESPASIAYGAPAVIASGTTADHFRADAAELIELMLADGAQFTAPAWAMSPATAIRLSLLGVDENLTLAGGTLLGVPVLVSTGVPDDPGGGSPDTEGARIFLIDAAEVLMADDGLEMASSTQGTVEMVDDPGEGSPPDAVQVSLWQTNCVAFRVTRFVRWKRRNDGAVGYITGANYGVTP